MAKKRTMSKKENLGKWKRGTQIKVAATPRPYTSSRGGQLFT